MQNGYWTFGYNHKGDKYDNEKSMEVCESEIEGVGGYQNEDMFENHSSDIFVNDSELENDKVLPSTSNLENEGSVCVMNTLRHGSSLKRFHTTPKFAFNYRKNNKNLKCIALLSKKKNPKCTHRPKITSSSAGHTSYPFRGQSTTSRGQRQDYEDHPLLL